MCGSPVRFVEGWSRLPDGGQLQAITNYHGNRKLQQRTFCALLPEQVTDLYSTVQAGQTGHVQVQI